MYVRGITWIYIYIYNIHTYIYIYIIYIYVRYEVSNAIGSYTAGKPGKQSIMDASRGDFHRELRRRA